MVRFDPRFIDSLSREASGLLKAIRCIQVLEAKTESKAIRSCARMGCGTSKARRSSKKPDHCGSWNEWCEMESQHGQIVHLSWTDSVGRQGKS